MEISSTCTRWRKNDCARWRLSPVCFELGAAMGQSSAQGQLPGFHSPFICLRFVARIARILRSLHLVSRHSGIHKHPSTTAARLVDQHRSRTDVLFSAALPRQPLVFHSISPTRMADLVDAALTIGGWIIAGLVTVGG